MQIIHGKAYTTSFHCQSDPSCNDEIIPSKLYRRHQSLVHLKKERKSGQFKSAQVGYNKEKNIIKKSI
jgi:hypothetical protein